MNRQILASPNWYYSAISDISIDGIFGYGGKNTIFLLDLTGPESCQYFGQLCGHNDRVTSVQFCKASAYSRFCVSVSDDHSVIKWDIDSKEAISKHNRHQLGITAVSWSQASHDWIYSGDEKGHIFSWDHQQNEVHEHFPLTGQINCISCPPDEEGVVVVGYKTGQIIVLMLQKEKQQILKILKGHNDEIHSLVWSPVPANELPGEIFGVPNRQESGYVLASGSRDKTIRIWNVSLGQFIAVVHVPSKSSKGKTSHDDYHLKTRLWNALCWPQTDPTCLISSGFNGNILAWDLSKSSKQKWRLFDEGRHGRIVFSICHHAANDVMISVSMDRQIHIWNRRDGTVITSLQSCGGFVYSLHVSVLDPSRLAIGVGDNMIRIWDTMAEGSSYSVTNLWRGIGTKVMKVLWHPVKEGLLAFGTEEGKVGIYNVMSQTCNVSRIYHNKSVYSLSWGPPSGDVGGHEIWYLYSCGGEGTILEHNPEHLHDEAKNVDKLIKTTNDIKHSLAGHTEVSCKPDRTLMAVGNEDGSIIFYRFPDLMLLATVNIHKRNITCLTWYRTHDPNDSKSMFLASGSNESDVHVHDLERIIKDVNQKVCTSSYRWLAGHSARVTSVVWSPHSDLKLASSSYDGTVQIWDVIKGEPLVNYRGHSDRVMTVAWSLIDSDVLFSGSGDFTVHSWRISEQIFKEPPLEARKPPKFSKSKSKKKKNTTDCKKAKAEHVAVKTAAMLEEKQSVGNATACDEKGPVKTDLNLESVQFAPGLPETTSLHFDNSQTDGKEENVSVAKEPLADGKGTQVGTKKKKRKAKSMFPLSASADNKTRCLTSQECVDIAKLLTNATGRPENVLSITSENINLGLFVNRHSAFSMLSEEGRHHAESGNIDYQLQLEIWKGNVGKALELAVERKQLSDWLVAVSHLAGEQVRLAVTEAFAEQLVSHGSFHRAALYYLACHKVYEAINMFKTAGMYREAISLAKVRLLPSDPLLLDLYSSWGRRLESEYLFEQASKCYLACCLHDDAIRVLTRRGDEMALHSAAQVAKLCGKVDLSQSLILQCALMATKTARWNDALEMVHGYSDMQPFLMLMTVHKTTLASLLKSEAITSDDVPEMQVSDVVPNSNVPSHLPKLVLKLKAQYERLSIDSASFWTSPSSTITGSHCVCEILERWWSDCGLCVPETRLAGLYVQISMLDCGQNFSNKEDTVNVLMLVAKNICLGLVAAVLAKPDICVDHFIKAITDVHDSGYFKLVCHLVRLLFPFGLESWHTIQSLSEVDKKETSSMGDQCFSNIMAFYYRAMLTKYLSDEKRRTTHDFEGSEQNCVTKNTGECSAANTIEHNNEIVNTDGTFTSCNEETNPTYVQHSRSVIVQTESELDSGVSRLHEGEMKETSFIDLYRIGLVCSTVLLSDIYAKFQKHKNDIEKDVPNEHLKDREDSGPKTEIEISLSKIPFPNVMESASMLKDLLNCIITSNKAGKMDKDMALKLSREVLEWVTTRELNIEQGESC